MTTSAIPQIPWKVDPLLRLVNEEVNRAMEAARQIEREACARIADAYANAPFHSHAGNCSLLHREATGAQAAEKIAAAIRARGVA